jgi:hypothetical protein
MKRAAAVLAATAIVLTSGSALADRYWRNGGASCTGSPNWSNTNCWAATSGGAPPASAPGAADEVIFDSTFTTTMTMDVASATIDKLTINAGAGTINLNGKTLSVDKNSTQAGGTVNLGAGSFTISNSNNWTMTGGTFNANSGTVSITNNLSLDGTSTVFNGGTASVTIDNNLALSGRATFNAGTGGTKTINNRTNVGGSATDFATFNVGSASVIFQGNFIMSDSTSNRLNGNTGSVAFNGGTYNVNAGTIDLSTTTSTTIATATITVENGATLKTGPATTFPSTLTVKNTGTFVGGTGLVTVTGALDVQTGGTMTTGTGGLRVSSTTSVSGAFTAGAGPHTFSQAASNPNGTFNLTSATSLTFSSGTLSVSGGTTTFGSQTFTVPAVTVSTSTGILNAGSSHMTITGALSLQGAVGATFNAQTSMTSMGSLAQSNGAFNGGSSTTTITGSAAVSGGTFTAGSGTITTQTDFTVSGGATLATAGSHFNVTHDFSVSGSGTTFTPGTVFFVVGHDATLSRDTNLATAQQVSVTGTVTVNAGITTLGNALAVTFGNLVVSGGTFTVGNVQLTVTNDGTFSVTTDLSTAMSLSFGGTLSVSAGTVTFPNSKTIPVGAISLTGTGILIAGTSSTVNVNAGTVVHDVAAGGTSLNLTGTTFNVGHDFSLTAGSMTTTNATRFAVGNNATFSVSATLTAILAMSVTGTLAVTFGTTTLKDGLAISIGSINVTGGTLAVNGANITTTGSVTVGGGTLQTTTLSTVTRLSVGTTFAANSGAFTPGSMNFSVTQAASFNINSDLSACTGLVFSSTIAVSGGTTTLGGLAITPTAVTVTGGTLLAGSGSITVSGATAVGTPGGTLTLAGGTTQLSTLSISSGGTFNSSTGAGTNSLTGALTMTGGTFNGLSGATTFNSTASISGTSAIAGSVFNAGSGIVRFRGAVTVGGTNLFAAFHAQTATTSFEAVTSVGVPDSLLVQGTATTPFDAAAGARLTFGQNAVAGTNAVNLTAGIFNLSLVTALVTISAGNVTIAGGTTFMAPALDTTFPATVTIAGTMTGNSTVPGLTKAMTFSGAVTINNGGLFSGGAGNRTFSSTLTILNGGTYTAGAGTQSFNTVGSAGTFNLTGAGSAPTPNFTTSLTVSGGTTTFGTHGGTASTIASLSVSGGTLDCQTNNASLTVSTATDVSGGTANLQGSGNQSLKAVTVSAGSLTLGSGTESLTSTLGVSGTGTFTAGTGNVTVTGAVTVSGGAAVWGSGTESLQSTLDVAGGTFTVGSGPLTVSGAANVNNGGIVNGGSSSNFRFATSLTLGTGAASAGTFNGQAAAITVVGATAVQSGSTFDAGTSGTLSLAGLTLGNATPTIGTFNANAKTVTASGAVLVQQGSIFNTNTGAVTLSGTTDLQTASTFNVNSGTVTFGNTFSLLGSSAFAGGTGSATFSVAPTMTSGTFTVGTAGTNGIITMTAGATFAMGATLAFPSDKGVLRLGNGTSLVVQGPITSTWASGSTRPKVDCSACAAGIAVTFRTTSTLNISGLELDDSVAAGLTIEKGATYTLLKNLKFFGNKGGAGSTHLAITLASALVNVPGCIFDTTAATNVTLNGDATAVRGARAIFEFQSTATNGLGAGEALDADGDSNADNFGDVLGSPYYGSVVEWVHASPTDTSGTAAGFPSVAFDWNTFQYYGIYVAYNNYTGGGGADRLWLRSTDGSPAYSYDVSAGGDIVGTPRWDTLNEVTANVDLDGDTLKNKTDVHVVYIATSNGHIIKLIDTGTAFVRPASGAWATDFVDATNVAVITSPLIADSTNLYFGGRTNGGATQVYGVQISQGAEKSLARQVATAGAVNTAPSWKVYGGTTYLYVGSMAMAGTAYIYRIDMTTGAVDAFCDDATANVNDGVRVIGNRAYAVTEGGTLHVLDASDFGVGGFTANVSGFPYQTAAASPIRSSPYIDPYTNDAYFGDNAGNLYVVGAAGSPATGYPYAIAGSPALSTTPVYLQHGGVIAVGAADGYLYFIDRHDNSNAPQIFKRYFITSAGTVSSVAYNSGQSKYMVSSSDGRLTFINGSDVTDPTSATE